MKATTIKVDGQLLRELEAEKPREETLTSFVRSIVEQELRRRRMVRAASAYSDFLKSNQDEREWLAEWDSADLAKAPRTRRS